MWTTPSPQTPTTLFLPNANVVFSPIPTYPLSHHSTPNSPPTYLYSPSAPLEEPTAPPLTYESAPYFQEDDVEDELPLFEKQGDAYVNANAPPLVNEPSMDGYTHNPSGHAMMQLLERLDNEPTHVNRLDAAISAIYSGNIVQTAQDMILLLSKFPLDADKIEITKTLGQNNLFGCIQQPDLFPFFSQFNTSSGKIQVLQLLFGDPNRNKIDTDLARMIISTFNDEESSQIAQRILF